MSDREQERIMSTAEAWEDGSLGSDEQYVSVANEDDEAMINEALQLQPISIRLEKSTIENFKLIAQINANGLGYQTLMRQALKRFAECEMKGILRKLAEEKRREAEQVAAEESPTPARTSRAKPQRKAA